MTVRRWFAITLAGFLPLACASESRSSIPAASAGSPGRAPVVSPEEARNVCRQLMVATRGCGELYVPALVRTRARFDQPPGIAARFQSEGEDALVAIAREEFKTDWADPSIEAHCQKLADMADEQRSSVVERERPCLRETGDCKAFVDCNMRSLERKWSPSSAAGSAAR